MHRLTALALKLILISGQRPGEVVGMRWDEIEGDAWTIPAETPGQDRHRSQCPPDRDRARDSGAGPRGSGAAV
ncbi:MAG: hypothetical protein MZV65_41850 [Chromatiales bacterium]|nr:hypothetical protein [Chromatiales bacterium]